MAGDEGDWEVWRLDRRRTVLVRPAGGPPPEGASAWASVAARETARRRGYALSSEVRPRPGTRRSAEGLSEAVRIGQDWARELGYGLLVEAWER